MQSSEKHDVKSVPMEVLNMDFGHGHLPTRRRTLEENTHLAAVGREKCKLGEYSRTTDKNPSEIRNGNLYDISQTSTQQRSYYTCQVKYA